MNFWPFNAEPAHDWEVEELDEIEDLNVHVDPVSVFMTC